MQKFQCLLYVLKGPLYNLHDRTFTGDFYMFIFSRKKNHPEN